MKGIKSILFILLCLPIVIYANPNSIDEVLYSINYLENLNLQRDTPEVDLPYPIEEQELGSDKLDKHTMDLGDPANIQRQIIYDPVEKRYIMIQKVGGVDYRTPMSMNYDDFIEEEFRNNQRRYLKEKSDAQSYLARKRKQTFENRFIGDPLLPENLIEISPNGNIELKFGLQYIHNANPIIAERNRRQYNPIFDMNIQANIIGNIGDLMKINFNYDTKSNFSVDRQMMNLAYTGKEDQIIKKIEAGNISLPTKSALITGSSRLFGIKSELQFGRLTITSVASQLQGNKSSIRLEGGAQKKEFEIEALDYDYNKHFFLGHYFREHYEEAVKNLPALMSKINITRIEVWVTNTNRQPTNNREVITLMDLGENQRARNKSLVFDPSIGQNITDNNASNLYEYIANRRGSLNTLEVNDLDLDNIRDYQINNARLLQPNEYSLEDTLGYITINRRLNADEVLGVAFEYTLYENGKAYNYKVGEFANEKPGEPNTTPPTLIIKMLKSSRVDPNYPMWDLMMKNIYSLNAYQMSKEDFVLDIYYQDPGGGAKRYIPANELEGIPLLQVLNLDNLNDYNQAYPNGFFDYIEGYTVVSQKGRLIFPMLEPFAGERELPMDQNSITGLRTIFGEDSLIAEKYAYDELYDSTQIIAAQYPEYNRYLIKGSYTSSVTSDISLGRMQIPQGSVIVTAGGAPLTEGSDYTVDYMMGRVKILRQDILNSGTPIDISFESADVFGISNKNLYATRLDYWINDNFTLGATGMRIAERPWQQNALFGSEPINNSIYGFDANYYSELPGLTKFLDKLPIVSTKETSSISLSGEYAKLVPGHPKVVSGSTGEGASALDNFEGAKIEYSIMDQFASWHLASAPTGETDILAASNSNDLDYGKQRALVNWRSVDQSFYNASGLNLSYGHYDRPVKIREIWPNRDLGMNAVWDIQRTFDFSFYPRERGPYNYATQNLDEKGRFTNPKQNWGGIMRYLPVTDFETNNFEMIEMWIMDPFLDDDQMEGELVINLGDISEDILKDGNLQYENGLPSVTEISPILKTSAWGITPAIPPVAVAFDTDPASRDMQDVGLDGLKDDEEITFFEEFVAAIESSNILNDSAKAAIINDPSADNFEYFRSERLDAIEANLIERYKYFNGVDGNSPSPTTGRDSSFIQRPTTEDLNRNNSLDDAENYYEYRIKINRNDFSLNNVGKNFIVSAVDTVLPDPNDPQNTQKVVWYQLQVPIKSYTKRVGSIDGFRSIRYMRMYMKGFEKPIHMRFASLALIKNQWRKYTKSLFEGEDLSGLYSDNVDNQNFNVSSVSLFEHGSKTPVNYVKPPGVIQERQLSQFNGLQRQDERAMSLAICDLIDGDARAVFKNMTWDIRNYKRIKTYVHAENPDDNEHDLKDQDLVFFIRFGMDNTFNYYEYQLPLKLTPPGIYTDQQANIVWDSIDVELTKFVNLKTQRNQDNFNPNFIYTKMDETINGTDRWISVKGNPDMSRIKSFLIGVRNPGQGSPNNPLEDDDGEVKCGEVWVNELRLVGFDEEGGAAALAMMEIQLADIGDIVLSGQMHQQGFGAIDATIMDRYLDDYYTYSASTQINLHKFLPKWLDVNVPFYAAQTKTVSTPRYDPMTGDTRLKDKLNAMRERGEPLQKIVATRDSASTVETNKSYNFTNVKKNKGKNSKRQHIYDLSNISMTYRHVENNKTNPFIAENSRTTDQGLLTYSFGNSPKNYRPFTKLIGRNKLLKPIKQFNYTLGFSNIAVSTNMSRQIGKVQLRSFGDEVELPTYQNKRFDWDRTYALKHKPAKSIDLAFNANTNSFLDEDREALTSKEVRQSISDEIMDAWDVDKTNTKYRTIGVITNYNHNTSANYKLPFKHFPYMSWVNMTAKHTTRYRWDGSNLILPELGNTISNGRDITLNANIKSRTLYRELKTLHKDIKKFFEKDKKSKDKTKEKGKGKGNSKAKPKAKSQSKASKLFKNAVTGIKTTSLSYSDKRTTIIPGFLPDPFLLGQSYTGEQPTPFVGYPGLDFSFGSQPFPNQDVTRSNWLNNLANPANNVFNDYDEVPRRIIWTEQQSINGKFGVEWIKSLRVDLNWKRDFFASNTTIFTNADTIINAQRWHYNLLNQNTQGNFKFTYISAPSLFTGDILKNDSTTYFDFKGAKRIQASQLFGSENGLHIVDSIAEDGYTYGNGPNAQQVLIPAFIAAYTGRDVLPSDINFIDPSNFKKVIPLPNWRLTYNGLAKLKPLKKYFANIKISHSYSSTYNFNSYLTNLTRPQDIELSISEGRNGLDTLGNYYQGDIINQVTINEKFQPLINFDVKMKNNFSWKLELSRSRTANLSFSTLNINEQKSRGIKAGAGYSIPAGILIPFFDHRTVKPIQIKLDYEIRDNITTLYGITADNRVHTGGTRENTLNISSDYQPGPRIKIRYILTYRKTKPYTSNNFPVTNLETFIQLTYFLF